MTKAKSVPVEYWQRAAEMEKFTRRKICLAAELDGCGGGIIQAHTIPRSQLLKIAESGHVYAFEYEGAAFGRNDGKLVVAKRGTAQFSVLNCFCREHDNKLFAPVEDKELVFDKEQLALLHYRAIAAELYKKQASLNSTELLIDKFKNKPGAGAAQRNSFLQAMLHGQNLGLRDVSLSFAKAAEIVTKGQYEDIRALVIKFKRLPSIMTVGAFAPEFDYDGRHIQTLGGDDTIVDDVSFSLLNSGGKACFAYIWFRDTKPGEILATSLAKQDPNKFTALLIQTAFEYIENTCMKIQWWDSLKSVERQSLTDRMMQSVNLSLPRSSRCLGFGGVSFDDWGYETHSFI